MTLIDLEEYNQAWKMLADWTGTEWNKKALINIAKAGSHLTDHRRIQPRYLAFERKTV